MKTLIGIFALLFLVGQAFAVDTTIEGLTLTEKQISQSESLKSDVVKGFAFWGDGKVVVTSTRSLDQNEQNALVIALHSLPDEYTKTAKEAKFDVRLFTDKLNNAFSAEETLALAPYYAVLKDQVAFPSFESAKKTLLGLVQAEILSKAGYATIAALFLEQGIDLEDYEVA